MKRKILLMLVFLLIVLIILTGCNNQGNNENLVEIENTYFNKIEEKEQTKPYNWVIEPKIEAEDIIDLDERIDVSLIKNGKKYNFINNDQGKELLREDFFGFAELEDGEIHIWQEGGKTFKVNEDYTLAESVYAGDYARDIVYYNTQRKEFFTQNFMYLVVTVENNEEILKKHKEKHGTMLECFVEVTPTEFTDDEFDKYAEFSNKDLGKYGYYNKENLKVEIEPIYDVAFDFYEDYAAVKKDDVAGFINLKGEEIFPFEFEETRSFDNGRAWVKLNGKWGVIELAK